MQGEGSEGWCAQGAAGRHKGTPPYPFAWAEGREAGDIFSDVQIPLNPWLHVLPCHYHPAGCMMRRSTVWSSVSPTDQQLACRGPV